MFNETQHKKLPVAMTKDDRKMSTFLIDPPIIASSFDEALDLAGYGRFHWLLLLGTGIGCMSIMVEDNCMAFVLPAAKCDLQLTPAEQGCMYVAATLGFVCSSHFWGFMADTWGRRKVLRTALALCCITSAISSLAANSWMLMGSRFVVGLSLSGIKGTSMSYLSEFHSARMRPVHLSFLSSFIMSSAMLQPLMAMAILRHPETFPALHSWLVIKSWRVFILVGSLVSGLGSLVLYWLPESPKFLLAMNNPDAALNVMQGMYAINSGETRESFSVKDILPLNETGTDLSSISSFGAAMSLLWAQTKPLLMPPNRVNFLLCCTLTAVTFFVTHGMLLWFPQIMTIYSAVQGQSSTTCAALDTGFRKSMTSCFNQTKTTAEEGEPCVATINCTTLTVSLMLGVFIVVFNTSIGLGMKRIGPKILQTMWYLAASAAAAALIWGRNFDLNSFSMIVVISCSASVASMCGVFGDLFPTHLRSMAMNLIMMCARLGGVVGSNVLAATIYWYCSQILAVYVALLAAVASIVWTVSSRCERAQNH